MQCCIGQSISDSHNHSGTKRPKYLEENAAAFFVKLSDEEVKYLSDLFHPEAVSSRCLVACMEGEASLLSSRSKYQ